MPTANPYEKVIENAIMTASKEELTLMLYEGGIKFCNQAIVFMEKKDYRKSSDALLRAMAIVRELQLTLNRKYAISKSFAALYDYMHRRLIDSNFMRDTVIITEVLDLFREFRDTWKEAMKLAKQGA